MTTKKTQTKKELMLKKPEKITKAEVKSFTKDEYSKYQDKWMEEILGSDFLMCKFGMCGRCPNCIEYKIGWCQDENTTPYIDMGFTPAFWFEG